MANFEPEEPNGVSAGSHTLPRSIRSLTISFELHISVKRDPERKRGVEGTPSAADVPPVTTVVLNGTFSESSYLDVMAAIAPLCGGSADTVFIDMQDVSIEDAGCLQRFAEAVMSQRAGGCHLQVMARQAAVHESLTNLNGSRDWLLLFNEKNVIGPRRALHLDRGGDDPA